MSIAGLSIAANAFAPVGLADIAFRLGKALYETLTRFIDAPKDVIELLNVVRLLENSIAGVRAYLSQYDRSLFMTEDGQSAPDLDDLLQGCSDEFTRLNCILNEATIRQGDSQKVQWTKRTRLLVNENDIKKSNRVLNDYINAIGVTLSTIQGQSQIKIREHAGLLQADIRGMQDAVLSETTTCAVTLGAAMESTNNVLRSLIGSSAQSTTDVVSTSTSKIRHDILALGTEAQRALSCNSDAIQSVSRTVKSHLMKHELANSARYNVLQKDISESATKTQIAVQSVKANIARTRKDQRTLVKQQMKKSDRILSGVTELLASVRISEDTSNGIHVEGHNLEAVLIPLLTIKPEITKMLSTLLRYGKMKLSNTELSWLETELENLIDISYTSRKLSNKSQSIAALSEPAGQISSKGRRVRKLSSSRADLRRTRMPDDVAKYTLETSIGTIAIRRYHYPSLSTKQDGVQHYETYITFSFQPSQSASVRIGFDIEFRNNKTSVPRKITLWEILPDDSDMIQLVQNDDLYSLRSLIQTGKHSLYSCDEIGNSLLAIAIVYNSEKTFDFLVRQGAHVRTRSTYYLMSHLDDQIYLSEGSAEYLFTRWQYMMTKVFNTGFESADVVTQEGETLLSTLCEDVVGAGYLSAEQVIAAARMLINHGDELNGRDIAGMTPLLLLCKYATFGSNPAIEQTIYLFITYLVNEGADPRAVNLDGDNCLHCICKGAREIKPQDWSPSLILIIQLLLSAGCDPNKLNQNVFTPFEIIDDANRGEHEVSSWARIFNDTPYEAMFIKSVWSSSFGETCMVVVERGSFRLPFSNLLVDQWIALRRSKERAYRLQFDDEYEDESDYYEDFTAQSEENDREYDECEM